MVSAIVPPTKDDTTNTHTKIKLVERVQLYGTVMSSAKKNYDVIFLLERII